MAYTKTVWQTGDTITATKLNNMENGIEANDAYISEFVAYKIYMHNTGTAVTISEESDISPNDITIEAYPQAAAGFPYFKIPATVIADLGKFAGWRIVIDKVSASPSTTPGSILGGASIVTADNAIYYRINGPAISTWEDCTYIIYIIPKESE